MLHLYLIYFESNSTSYVASLISDSADSAFTRIGADATQIFSDFNFTRSEKVESFSPEKIGGELGVALALGLGAKIAQFKDMRNAASVMYQLSGELADRITILKDLQKESQ